MGMITNKKIIAVLLIPIMLIVFVTPCFATEVLPVANMDFSAIAQKVLQIAMKVGVYSFQVGKQFAGEFMGIHDITDLITMGTKLFSTGMTLVGPLFSIVTQINIQDPSSILGVLRGLLGWGIDAIGQFSEVLFGKNLTNPTNLFEFATDVIKFSVPAITGLVDAIFNGEDVSLDLAVLGGLGDLATGSTGALSGIVDLLFQGSTEQPEEPEAGVAGAVADLSQPDFINMLANIGELGIIDYGTETIEELYDLFFNVDTENPKDAIDFNEIVGTGNNDDNDEKTDKTNMADDNNNYNNLGDYSYTHNEKTYKIAVTSDQLDKVLSQISEKNLNQNYAKQHTDIYPNAAKQCDEIANYHIYMLLGQVSNPTLSDCLSRGDNGGTPKYGSVSNLKKYIDDKKPCRVHTIYNKDSGHWLTCIGYTDDANTLSDFLFVSSYWGYLITGAHDEANPFYTIDYSDAIRIYN